MRSISIGQIIVLMLISFLLFGDFKKLKKKIKNMFSYLNTYFDQKNRKKGI